jgi:pimeloyl-ACP methyl ester carboxylesterase
MSPQLNYHRQGDGAPLVLLHGVGHHWQAWAPVIELLAGSAGAFDVIACDLPGFGRSAPLPPAIEPSVQAYADAFEMFFAELGLERPHVAGNSMGGAIALELARRRSVASATAFSPAGFWTAAERRYCQLSLGALGRTPRAVRPPLAALARTRAGRVALFGQTFGFPARLPAPEAEATLRDAWAAPALSGALDAFSGYRYTAPEKPLPIPVTIAWGNRDRLLPYALQAPRARRMLPWATHITLGAGHVPFYDDPPACAAVIRSGAGRAAPRVRARAAAPTPG